MTTLTIDRYKVFRCLGMVERRRLSSIFSRCSDFSHSLAMKPTAPEQIIARNLATTPCRGLSLFLVRPTTSSMKAALIIPLMFASIAAAAPPPEYQPIDIRPLRDKISVRVRQTVLFTFDQRGDRLVNPRPARGAEKQPMIRLELMQDRGKSILFITSSFPRTLQYRGAALFRGRPTFVTTNSYPVYSGVVDAEGFPGDIQEFVLWDIRLTNIRKP
jgi:hypothetical protein